MSQHARRVLLLALLAALFTACGRDGSTSTSQDQSGANRLLGDRDEVALDLGADLPRPDLAERIEAMAERAGAANDLGALTVDYPQGGSVFPPDFVAPTFLWHDDSESDTWLVEVGFSASPSETLLVLVPEREPPKGEIDETVLGPTNEIYQPTTHQATAHAWTPSEVVWSAIKRRSVDAPARVSFTGFRAADAEQPLTRGAVSIQTSADPVGAPIFYRDVPLMPFVGKKGEILPLGRDLFPKIAWRLRDVAKPESRVILKGMFSCGNCHSFSADGSTFGMDIDGPQGDKGTYAVLPITQRMSIEREDLITWSSFPDKPEGHKTIGFLSRVSPDGRYVISTVNELVFVANFKEYGFLQVFFPTRGILACYDTQTKRMKALPGADDPEYVHAGGVWSPDGEWIVFSRARAFDPWAQGKPLPTYAGDPNEPTVQYDLYRLPFNGGAGGTPEPIQGASANGMSNSFPKVSHDGKWIVWVKSKNGQLMRPDSRLWIVPFEGGEAREMRCNTNKMNSWHSFSPNSRWMVFSSKVNRPYTQMFLTHIDADGQDTPPILIPNSTADNRAVNLPEFLNGSQDVLRTIHVPAVDHHAPYQLGLNLAEDGKYLKATEQFKLALKEDPTFTRAYVGLGQAYVRLGRLEEALQTCEKGLQANPWSPELLNLIATVLYDSNRREEAIRYFEKGLELDQTGSVLANLLRAVLQMDDLERKLHYLTYAIDTEPRILNHRRVIARVLVEHRRSAEAIPHLNTLLHVDDKDWESKISLAWALATTRDSKIRDGARAVGIAREAVAETRSQEPAALAALAASMAEAGQVSEALELAQKAQRLPSRTQSRLVMDLPLQIQAYRAGKPYRE